MAWGQFLKPFGRNWRALEANVERGRLFETPCFEWLDANETKTTTLTFELRKE